MTRYFIQHKTTKSWLTIDGELTDDLSDNSLLSFNDKFSAEQILRTANPKFNSIDFLRFAWQEIFYKQVLHKNNGADLHSDFVVSEHKYLKFSQWLELTTTGTYYDGFRSDYCVKTGKLSLKWIGK